MCLKATYEKNDEEITTLSYTQMFASSVKLDKENEKLERNSLTLKDDIEYLKGKVNKWNWKLAWDHSLNQVNVKVVLFFLNEIENLHEMISKFTKDKENIDLILSN